MSNQMKTVVITQKEYLALLSIRKAATEYAESIFGKPSSTEQAIIVALQRYQKTQKNNQQPNQKQK